MTLGKTIDNTFAYINYMAITGGYITMHRANGKIISLNAAVRNRRLRLIDGRHLPTIILIITMMIFLPRTQDNSFVALPDYRCFFFFLLISILVFINGRVRARRRPKTMIDRAIVHKNKNDITQRNNILYGRGGISVTSRDDNNFSGYIIWRMILILLRRRRIINIRKINITSSKNVPTKTAVLSLFRSRFSYTII